jgi:nucleotidyltransferase/DNA polymerase involved in DNA repair
VGVASNKLVAKIASEFRKPDGLTVVREGEAEAFLAPLPVRKMLWIGEKTERRLNELGIKTIGDLARSDVSFLINRFGVMGKRFHECAHGSYVSGVSEGRRARRSFGHESTFATDADDCSRVLNRLDDICRRIHERITNRNLLFKTITVKIRYADFETHTHGKTLSLCTDRIDELRKATRELVQPYLHKDKRIRLIGIRVSNLRSAKGQITLS